MQAKLIVTFTSLNESAFLTKTGGIVNGLRANPAFPEPWLPQVGTHADLEAAFTTYQQAFLAASTGDRTHIAERDAARAALTERLKKLAPFLEAVADGDTVKLMSTGYDLWKDSTRGNGGPLPAPSGFTAKHGTLSGQVVLHASRLAGAKSYEVSHTTGDPNTAGTVWTDAGTFTGCSKIELDGLARGRAYWFRLRGVDGKGYGAWTDPASLMVL